MISYREFRFTDYKTIKNLLNSSKNRRMSYDINYLNIEKMIKCFLFFNDNKLAMLSGIDNISEFVPNTFRILTRAITTKYSPKCWGPTIEEKFFSNIMAGISVEYCEKIDDNMNIVITTNENSRISNVVIRQKKDWMSYRDVKMIYGVPQIIWNINLEKCKNMTNKWKEKLCMDF